MSGFGDDSPPSANSYAADIEAALSERGPTEWPCRRSGNYIECDDSVKYGSDAPDFLVDLAFADAKVKTDAIGLIPGVGWVWNQLMDWVWSKGEASRKRRLREMNRRARSYAQSAMQRVFYLKIEDAVRALGYGPLLDFLGSREWLEWDADIRRPRYVRSDGFGRPPPTPSEKRAQLRETQRAFGGDQIERWTHGPQGIAFVESEGPPSARRLIGGEGWAALTRFMAGTNRRGGTDRDQKTGAWDLTELEAAIPPALLIDRRFAVCDPHSTEDEEYRCRFRLAWSIVAIAALMGRRGMPPHLERGMVSLENAYAAELRYLRQRGVMPRERVRFVVNVSNQVQRPCPAEPAAVAAYYFQQHGSEQSRRQWCTQTNSQMRDQAIAAGVEVSNRIDGKYGPKCGTIPAAVAALFAQRGNGVLGRDTWCTMSFATRAAWLAQAGIIADPFTGQPLRPAQGYSAGAAGPGGADAPDPNAKKSNTPLLVGGAAAALLGAWFITRKK